MLLLQTAFGPVPPRDDDDTNSMPLVDVVGHDILLWTRVDTKTGWIEGSLTDAPDRTGKGLPQLTDPQIFYVPQDSPRRRRRIQTYAVLRVHQGIFALRIAPRPADEDGSSIGPELIPDGGAILVRVPRAVSGADTLVKQFARADENPRVRVTGTPFMTDAQDTTTRDPRFMQIEPYADADGE